ncbi:Proline-, glutamic acid- and leucine-rich protein 1 [Frankliniella fusca]|uniref:Proline-, glutamic acid- and leucine-rich protein 1 n=1 Tax=Frankliniella fusca TaxID=407009 RepID=A0AAE1HLT3_9NEOP|nr:Proline-, glutamic acid- and leucine-rich protein 1 [Frankliniella fusca]
MEDLSRGIANLLRPALESDFQDELLESLLMSCADQRVFSKGGQGVQSILSLINTKLNDSSTRFHGLILLHTFLPQCSLDILSQNACSWMQFCLKGISVRKTSEAAFSVFQILLEQSVLVPELAKHVSSVIVASFAEQINHGIPPQANVRALECLEKCMQLYNGPCGPHRKVFEHFLFSMVDSTDPERFKAARCVAMLPQIGGGGVGGIQYENSWVTQHHSILRTLHLLLDELYSNVNELNMVINKLGDVDPLSLPAIEEANPMMFVRKLMSRFVNVSSYLMFMLILPYPVPKEISAECIMHLVSRGLGVTGSSIGNVKTTHSLALLADLPFVHTSLLKVLEALMMICGTNILPFASLICKLAVQSLKWTSVDDWPFGTDKPFSILRAQAYHIIKVWCGIGKSGSNINNFAQQLVELAKSDIYSDKQKQIPTFNKKQRNAKPKGRSSLPNESKTEGQLPCNKSANKDVCVAALQAMQAMLMSASSQVQPVVHKVLHEVVVSLLLKVTNKVEDAPIPYTLKEPRLELYSLLLQLVLDSHHNLPPPTSISRLCQIALSSIDKIIHPAYASLNFMPERTELERIETAVAQARPSHSSSNQSSPTPARPQYDADGSEHEITDAVSMSNANEMTFSPKHRSTSVPNNDLFRTPSASTVDKPNQSLPVSVEKQGKERNKTVDLTSPDPQSSAPDNDEKEGITKTVDLTLSDKSEDEADVSEVPCEIDLADSDDDKSNVSMCSQTTLNTPLTESNSQALKEVVNQPVTDAAEKKTVLANEACVSDTYNESTRIEKSPINLDGVALTATSTVEESMVCPAIEGEGSVAESADSKRGAETQEESLPKKQKLSEEFEFDSCEEDALLLSFQDVTRDEVEESVE